MCGLRLELIDDNLKSIFSRLGGFVGRQSGYFIIVPLLLTALAATGFQRIHFEADPEYLFSPSDGESHYERSVLESQFPTDYYDFEPGRATRGGRFGRLIVRSRDGGSLLRTHVWNQILFLEQLVRNISIPAHWEAEPDTGASVQVLEFTDVCASYQGLCWENEVLNIATHMPDIESGKVKLTYPLWFDPNTFSRYAFNFFFGGVKLTNDSTIESVTALSLLYFLKSKTAKDVRRGSEWEAVFLATVEAQDFPDIVVSRFSSLTLEVELENNTNSIIPYFALNIGIMITFCIITCMMTDWVKSKPLLGLLGVISAILATVFSFGLIIYCGIPFIGINLAAPFLMLGIGIDDTFVMLGAWRRTSVHDSVPQRMAQTYRDAAVSITITSITDVLSFWIGIITPFPSVRIFCAYTGGCVAFTYLWHITFFGGCMAIAGYAEKSNRHSLTCLKVTPKSKSGHRAWLYRIFCSGGISTEDPFNKKDNAENAIMIFFRDYVAAALNNKYFKAFILALFAVYLGFASWGISNLKEGLERRKLARFDSYSVDYYDMEETYFREYPYRVNVVLSGRLDYSDQQIQSDIEELLTKLENTTYIDKTFTESWYRDFLDYVKRNKDYIPIDISSEQAFIDTLNELYLQSGSTHYTKDIRFNEDNSSIIASRFVIQGAKIYNANQEKEFVQELRDICHASKYNITVFHPYFIYFDQFLIVLPMTVQCVTVAAIVMMVISLIFIPNPMCSLWVAFSIISIELGVLGFMTLWEVSLDSISMINLIMCIGFSVDFSAHISYHFMSREVGMSERERVRDSMYALGLPITQGAISTILGVVGLALAPSYVFITFFKMVFLVIILGALHGIFLLPILLSLMGPGSCRRKKKEPGSGEDSSTSSSPPLSSSGSSSSTSSSSAGNGKRREKSKPLSSCSISSLSEDDKFTTQIKIPRPSTGSVPNNKANKYNHQRHHEMYTNSGYESEEMYYSHFNDGRGRHLGERDRRQHYRPDYGRTKRK